jgi:hypothetical protein
MNISMFVLWEGMNKMKKSLREAYLLLAIALGLSLPVFAARPGEGIVKDAQTGDYIITYCGVGPDGAEETCILRRVIFVPATKIDPLLKSSLKLGQPWSIQYSYAITNRSTSAQPLGDFMLDPLTNIESEIPLSKQWGLRTENQMDAEMTAGVRTLSIPAAWKGFVVPSHKVGLRIAYINADGLKPGRSQRGFGFSSADLPGIGVAQLSGNSGTNFGFEDEGPEGDIADQLDQLQHRDFVPRYAAVPAINISNPFNAATVLRSIQQQTQTWVGMQLLDPALSSQLDRLFQVAIDAAGRNDSERVNGYLAEIRKLIRNEHQDLESERDDDKDDNTGKRRVLIARLAAQVLDFDIKYIRMRLGGGHEEGDKD